MFCTQSISVTKLGETWLKMEDGALPVLLWCGGFNVLLHSFTPDNNSNADSVWVKGIPTSHFTVQLI